MASSPTSQVPSGSLDTAGISVSTATPVANNARAGTMYNLSTLAAAQPVWFHPMFDGRYLMVNSRTWTAATPAGGTGFFSSYTENTEPSWVIVDGPSGATSQVPNYPLIPISDGHTTATVVAAASRPPGYLYLLHAATYGSANLAILQHVNLTTNGAITVVGEEVLPTVALDSSTVVFDRGIQFADPYLILYGSDSDGTVYSIRKPWSKIGVNPALDPQRTDPSTQFQTVDLTKLPNVVLPTTPTVNPSPQTHAGIGATQVEWEYYTGTGYSTDSTQLAPLTTVTGVSLTTLGPMSFVSVNNQLFLSTVLLSGSTHKAQMWSSRSGRPITAVGSPISLGSGSAYLGGGLGLQPLLSATTVPSGAIAAIPYVISTKLTSGSNHSLLNTWSTFPVIV